MSTEMNAASRSPGWKRPDEVMRLHRLKVKKKALQARMIQSGSQVSQSESVFTGSIGSVSFGGEGKRKNPFRCEATKRVKPEESADLDASCDNTLFQLLNSGVESLTVKQPVHTSFSSILSKINCAAQVETPPQKLGKPYIPVDWTLKTKARCMSRKSLAWNAKLKTCEEASGITGFVRCLHTDQRVSESCCIDTSPTARFHQCCLYWQHPELSWLELFPRSAGRVTATAQLFASDRRLRDSLHRAWCESFRSLYQLVRARQCPYFYLCANNFTCLFRAAGICGYPETHALLTPTTRGFRRTLTEEDIEFSMPLKKTKRLSSSSMDSSQSVLSDEQSQSTPAWTQPEDVQEEQEEEEEEEAEEWLESMGVGAEEIKRLNSSQAKLVHDKEREVDRTPESLVYVQGIATQSLFNFLMNCKSAVAATGPLAGIPPTLLAPVAFHGATLKALKVRRSHVTAEGSTFDSVELKGPIMPHMVHNLCAMLDQTANEFSATFANVESTRPFSLAAGSVAFGPETTSQLPTFNAEKSPIQRGVKSPRASPVKVAVPSVFGKESLSDCGLSKKVLDRFCCEDPSRVFVIDSLKYNSDGTYTWT